MKYNNLIKIIAINLRNLKNLNSKNLLIKKNFIRIMKFILLNFYLRF